MIHRSGKWGLAGMVGLTALWCSACAGPSAAVNSGSSDGAADAAKSVKDAAPSEQPAFPQDWLGDWEGRVAAHFPGGRSNDFAMRLEIHPTDSADRFTWRIIYGEGEQRQVRDYELVVVDAAKGHYRVDEKNSIVIDCYFIADALHCQFRVEDAQITTTYARHGDDLAFSILSCDMGHPIKSGAEGEIPEVLTYPIEVSQFGLLKKIETGT